MKALFHIHTTYSYDSNLSIPVLVDYALKHGFDYVFITDHDTIQGALAAKRYVIENGLPLQIVIGMEIKTDIGDIIGLFLKTEIRARHFSDVIREIKDQGGTVVLPHPYKQHDLFQIHFLEDIDYVEVFNARLTPVLNGYAEKLATHYGAKKIVGTDAHRKNELKACYIRFNDIADLREGEPSIHIESYIKRYSIYYSQMIKGMKCRNVRLFLKSFLEYLLYRITGK